MLKQYRLTREHNFKQTLEVYHDGELLFSRPVWVDERETLIEELEAEGYTYGYTTIEIHRQKKIYEMMLESAIPGR